MPVTLLDGQGLALTEISSRMGRSAGQVPVDWADRPDALFRYYFDRSGRAVTLVDGAERYLAMLGTRWQMGARCWFLHMVDTAHPASAVARAPETPGVQA